MEKQYQIYVISEDLEIRAVHNFVMNRVKLIKAGEILDDFDTSGYSEEQIKHYIKGLREGLQTNTPINQEKR